jgi:hypothetical protein
VTAEGRFANRPSVAHLVNEYVSNW